MKKKREKESKKEFKNSLKSNKMKSSRKPTLSKIRKFRKDIYSYYRVNGRDLPWRKTHNPYNILVSEIMLQQTQVQRVKEKYVQFTGIFPDFPSLSRAPLRKILREWQGMGYNRRAISLKQISLKVVKEFDGNLPTSVETLMAFPGIGRATASSIAAFAFQHPTVFIETNIRRVFIHCFFHDTEKVDDSEIFPLVEKALDTANPREWYYALMDYGVMLKQKYENPNRRSAHYQKQSPFQGSNRQVRGMVLKLLVNESDISEFQIKYKLHIQEEKLNNNLKQLVKEGFIKEVRGRYSIA